MASTPKKKTELSSAKQVRPGEANARAQEGDELTRLQQHERELEAAVTQLQLELLEVRARTGRELAAAQDRLYWMDENHLGPEMFKRRAYVRFLVRALAAMRFVAARMRRMKRD